MESVINDVELLDLAVIPTDGGPVMHMMRPASPLFGEIGEVYFSEVEPGCVKAWKCHTRQTQRFAVPVGQLKIVLYDDRPESPTRGRIMEVLLGRPDNYAAANPAACLVRLYGGGERSCGHLQLPGHPARSGGRAP